MKPDDIRITDLSSPELTELQRQAIAGAPPTQMNEELVLAAARQRTGLSDFGAQDFRERLRIWLQSFDEDTGLGPLGRAGLFNDAVRYASARLRFEDLVKQHPEISDVEIQRPIIVAGCPVLARPTWSTSWQPTHDCARCHYGNQWSRFPGRKTTARPGRSAPCTYP